MVITDGTPDPSVAQSAPEVEEANDNDNDAADDKTAASAISRSSHKSTSSNSTIGVPPSGFIGPVPAPKAADLQTNQRFNTNQRRSIHEIVKVRPFIKQSDRSSLSTRELTQHRQNAVASLTSSFELPNLTSDNEILNQTHSISTQIRDFKRRLERYDMVDVFKLVLPLNIFDQTHIMGADLQTDDNGQFLTLDLLEHYATIKEEQVKISNFYFRLYGQSYDLENLDWSKELLECSCEQSLRDKAEERIADSPEFGGGPLYFWHIMNLILSSSEQAATTLTERINSLKIYSIPGEDVLKAVSLLRSAIVRLKHIGKLPLDIRKKILDVLQTTSIKEFNEIFRIMKITTAFTSAPLSVETILQIAESTFVEMQEASKWVGNSSDASMFNAIICHRCGGVGHVFNSCPEANKATHRNQNVNNSSNGKRGGKSNAKRRKGRFPTGPEWTTPPTDGIKTKTINGIIHHWCHHCQRWSSTHGTKSHTGPKRDSSGKLINVANTNTESTSESAPSVTTSESSSQAAFASNNDFATASNVLRRWS